MIFVTQRYLMMYVIIQLFIPSYMKSTSPYWKAINPYPIRKWKWLVFATSIEPGQPVYPCNLIRLYTVGWQTLSFHLNIPKYNNGQLQNGRWVIPFKKSCSLTRLYTIVSPTSSSYLDIPKNENGQFRKKSI